LKGQGGRGGGWGSEGSKGKRGNRAFSKNQIQKVAPLTNKEGPGEGKRGPAIFGRGKHRGKKLSKSPSTN